MTAKMKCSVVMDSKPHHTAYVTAKIRCSAIIILAKPHRTMNTPNYVITYN